MIAEEITDLRAEIAACQICAAHLPHGVRPVMQFGATASIVIIGQAPGARVHASGIPWDDASGARLCDWTGLVRSDLLDSSKVALLPMGFCYPGTGKSGDLPPRPECAPQWHERVLKVLPDDRLILLVGSYAQARYLKDEVSLSLTERVQSFSDYLPSYFPLPHPSWRTTGWMKKNPWFESNVVPALRGAVGARLSRATD